MSFTYAGLFSGIGMLERACEMLGGNPVFMCESEPFCQRILRKRYLDVPLADNVHEVHGSDFDADVLVFGFPCQDVSAAGRAVGISGARSGLWKEGFRIISEARPKLVLIENVAMLTTRGLREVLIDLRSIGYHAEWDIISAAAVGAAHLRERIWIAARPAEFADQLIYDGGDSVEISIMDKLPRAGLMTLDDQFAMHPTAPRKLKRQDGWSYWNGVDLFDLDAAGTLLLPTPTATVYGSSQNGLNGVNGEKRRPSAGTPSLASIARHNLWPTPTHRDWKDTGDLNCVPEKSLLPRRVFHVESGNWPRRVEGTGGPAGNDGIIEIVGSFGIEETLGLRPSGGSQPMSGSGPEPQILWPTPTRATGEQGPGTSGREGGDNLVTRVARNSPGPLNPTWVEWLMAMPLWWTDPDCPLAMTTQTPWWIEPDIQRTEREIPYRKERLKATGNSVVWLCAYYVLKRGLAATPVIYERKEQTA